MKCRRKLEEAENKCPEQLPFANVANQIRYHITIRIVEFTVTTLASISDELFLRNSAHGKDTLIVNFINTFQLQNFIDTLTERIVNGNMWRDDDLIFLHLQ